MTSPDTRKRNASTCDYCCQHKTKVCLSYDHPPNRKCRWLTMFSRRQQCTKLENDSCKRCLKAGRPCVTSNTRTGRPYYQSSKEQYDLLTTVVRHFLPNAPLNKESLREIVTQLPSNSAEAVSQPRNSPAALPNGSFVGEMPELMRLPSTGRRPPLSSIDLNVETQATSAPYPHGAGHAQDASHLASSHMQPESMRAIIPTSAPAPNGYTHNHSQQPSNDVSKMSPTGSAEHIALASSQASCANETFPIESIVNRDVMNIARK